MAELCNLDVVIYDWPASRIKSRSEHRGQTFPDELRIEHLRWRADGDGPPSARVAEAMHALRWDEFAAIEYDPAARVLRVSADHSYPIAAVEAARLLDALCAAGLPFYLSAAGTSEWLPEFRAWVPSWPDVRGGPATPDGDPLLDAGRGRLLLLSGGVVAITDYFATREAVAGKGAPR